MLLIRNPSQAEHPYSVHGHPIPQRRELLHRLEHAIIGNRLARGVRVEGERQVRLGQRRGCRPRNDEEDVYRGAGEVHRDRAFARPARDGVPCPGEDLRGIDKGRVDSTGIAVSTLDPAVRRRVDGLGARRAVSVLIVDRPIHKDGGGTVEDTEDRRERAQAREAEAQETGFARRHPGRL